MNLSATWRVMKFGGTSVGTPAALASATSRVAEAAAEISPAGRVMVVASAMAGVTDRLTAAIASVRAGADVGERVRAVLGRRHLQALWNLHLAEHQRLAVQGEIHQLLLAMAKDLAAMRGFGRRAPARSASVLATGERLSCLLFAAALRALDMPSAAVNGERMVATDAAFPQATWDLEATRNRVRSWIGANPASEVPVVNGFVGANSRGGTTLLGRGGSDVSATLLGAALAAERIEIWTDVDGVMTADPKRDQNAQPIPYLCFRDAAYMAGTGAKVLQPGAVEPARLAAVPIWVRNSFRPKHPGTWIDVECGQRSRRRPSVAVGR